MPSYSNDSKPSSSFSNDSKPSSSFSNDSKPTIATLLIGNPIGLLLSLTYVENNGLVYSQDSKPS